MHWTPAMKPCCARCNNARSAKATCVLQREVDLVTERSISNLYLRQEIERDNAVVYAA